MMPGKGDFTNCDGVKVQKRYLNDYMHNLHAKFRAENPEINVSRSVFCRRRPAHIFPPSFTSRHTCLCQHHQNMSLKLRGIKACGIKVTTNPDTFIKENSTDGQGLHDIVSALPATVKYSQWKRVEDADGKKKMKIVSFEVRKKEFATTLREDIQKFSEHVARVKTQYDQLKKLKDRLPENHAIVQMDFAENYTCQSNEEVQSAYWNASMVTLHPAVAYMQSTDGKMEHNSRVFVSDELGHNAGTVFAILKKLLSEMKLASPNLTHVHYYTDSPTSQYRNKTIFYIISKHKSLFGVSASWNYFEAGHGKGPCDGVGGSVKRMADEAVRQQKVIIQDASDFFSWTQQYMSASSVSFTFVSQQDCKAAQQEIEAFGDIKTVTGTMKIHAVASLQDHEQAEVIARETSCYCEQCFSNGVFSVDSPCKWKRHLLKEFQLQIR